MIIADTSVMVEIADGSEKGRELEEYIIKAKDELAITVFTVHELLLPTSGKEREELEESISEYKTLAFDYLSALESVKLNDSLKSKGAMLSKIDLFIASICKSQEASLLTLDSDFRRVPGLRVAII
jgi:predicted nucleic acid-binding protein